MSTVVMKRVVRACDYVPAHLRRGPMKYTEIEVTEKETKSMMKFSEVIAALENGKKVAFDGDLVGAYYQMLAPAPGLEQRLTHVFSDGKWALATLACPAAHPGSWSVVE